MALRLKGDDRLPMEVRQYIRQINRIREHDESTERLRWLCIGFGLAAMLGHIVRAVLTN